MTEKSELAGKDANDFLDFYLENEILFKEDTCKIINMLNTSFKEAWKNYHMYPLGKPTSNPVNEEKRIELCLKAYFDILHKEVPALKKQLKEEFRIILGVN